MKRLLLFSLLALTMLPSTADTLTIRQAFIEMPDSLIPYLSHNSRLDFIDFMDSQMKAEITNDFGGKSLMTALGDDSLTIRLNVACTLDLLLLTTTEPVDNSRHVIAMITTVGVEDGYQESSVEYYSVNWNRLTTVPTLTADDRKRLESREKPLKILKFIGDKLNKN